MKTLLRIGMASGVQLITEVLAWTLFGLWVMGLFGTQAMAANTFMYRYMIVSFMPAFGLSVAVTALVGRYIGAGRPDIAARRARLAFIVAAIYMMVCGLFFFLGRNLLIGLFTNDPQIRHTGGILLTFAAVYQFFDALYIIYNGGLRGAGDTLVPAVATAGLCWGITVGGGYLVARFVPGLGPAGPWVVATLYGIILGLFMYVRFQRGGWRNIRLGSAQQFSNVTGDSDRVMNS
jgi:MATE family multidrug resistance protein